MPVGTVHPRASITEGPERARPNTALEPTGGIGRIFHRGGGVCAFPLGNVRLAPAAQLHR